MRSTQAIIVGCLSTLTLVTCAVNQNADLAYHRLERRADRPQRNTQIAWVGVNGPGSGWTAENPHSGHINEGGHWQFRSTRLDPASAYGKAYRHQEMSSRYQMPEHPVQVRGGAIGRLVAMADITVARGGQAKAISVSNGVVQRHQFRAGRHAVNALGNGEPGSAQVYADVSRPGSLRTSALDHQSPRPQDASRRGARNRISSEINNGRPNTLPQGTNPQHGSIQHGPTQQEGASPSQSSGQQGGTRHSTLHDSSKVSQVNTKVDRKSSPMRKSGKSL